MSERRRRSAALAASVALTSRTWPTVPPVLRQFQPATRKRDAKTLPCADCWTTHGYQCN